MKNKLSLLLIGSLSGLAAITLLSTSLFSFPFDSECCEELPPVPPDGWTYLHEAGYYRDLPLARKWVEKGMSLHTLFKRDGYTPLQFAVKGGSIEIVRLYLDHGAKVDTRSKWGSTPLHLAKTADIAKLLIERGADPNSRSSSGATPLHSASGGGHVGTAQVLLKHGVEVDGLRKESDDSSTPARMAIGNGQVESLKVLVEHGADLKKHGWDYMSYAIGRNFPKVAKYLMSQGLSIDERAFDGTTTLHLLADQGAHKILDWAVKMGAEVNARDKDGMTPLHHAVWKPNPISEEQKTNLLLYIRKLVEHGAEVNAQANLGSTPLLLAVQANKIDFVKLLLELGGDPEIEGQYSGSMYISAYFENREIAELLVPYMENPIPFEKLDEITSPLK